MRRRLSVVIMILSVVGGAAAAVQRDDDIARLVQLIEQGKADQAKKELRSNLDVMGLCLNLK